MGYLLSNKLRALRKNRNLTQTDVGNYLNMSRQGYAHYENGHQTPDYEILIRLAKLYQVSVDELINKDEIPIELTPLFEINPYIAKDEEKVKRRNITVIVNENEWKLIQLYRKLNEKDQNLLLDNLRKRVKKK